VPVPKKSRWLLLKREENLKTEQRFRLRDLLRYNLKTVRAYLLKEAFQQLWDYSLPASAGTFLDDWCRQVMRSRPCTQSTYLAASIKGESRRRQSGSIGIRLCSD
jgi:transposase